MAYMRYGVDVDRRYSLIVILNFCLFIFLLSPSKSVADDACDRLCKAKYIVSFTPISPSVINQERQLEAWASELMEHASSAAYVTYMDGYEAISTKRLDAYATRYVRRQLRGDELSALYVHTKGEGKKALNKDIRAGLLASSEDVKQYTKKLIWGGMRETRKYLVRRLAEVSGAHRLAFTLDAHSRHFVGQYMVQSAERWSLSSTQQSEADHKAMKAATSWLSEDMDQDKASIERSHKLNALDRLTYQLRHLSDSQIRSAISFYEHPLYQKILGFIEVSMDLHFQRQYSKNNLSDPMK